jgi:hypothetical protein
LEYTRQWHLGFRTWGHTPLERGFDSHFGYFAGSTDYYKVTTARLSLSHPSTHSPCNGGTAAAFSQDREPLLGRAVPGRMLPERERR